MKAQVVPRHVQFVLTENEGETFRRLLRTVDEDGEFPLNEAEDELVTAMIVALDDLVPQ